MVSLKLKVHQNPFSASAPPRTPLAKLRKHPRPHPIVGHLSPFPSPRRLAVSNSPPSADRRLASRRLRLDLQPSPTVARFASNLHHRISLIVSLLLLLHSWVRSCVKNERYCFLLLYSSCYTIIRPNNSYCYCNWLTKKITR